MTGHRARPTVCVLAVFAVWWLSPPAARSGQGPAPSAPPLGAGEARDLPDVAGTWNGTYVVENCVRTSGSGPSYCRFVLGAPRPIALTLRAGPASLGGSISFLDADGRTGSTGAVDGRIAAARDIELTASRVVNPADSKGVTTVTDWRLTLSADGTILTGRFVLDRMFVSVFGPQVSREDCRLRLTRSPEPAP